MTIIHEIKGDEPGSLMSILYSTNGFFTGNIIIDAPVRPEMGLSDSIQQQNESYELFENMATHTVAARYGVLFNTPMIVMTQMLAVGRYPTKDEIEHDLDHFGIEQMLWSKGHYAKLNEIRVKDIDTKIPRYKFPKGSFMGSEEYIYVGPMRMQHAQCATFIDRYPLRTNLEYMIDTIKGMKPTEEKLGKDKIVGDGGFLVDITYKGLLHPMRWQRSSPFPGGEPEDVPIHDPATITPQAIERAYIGLKRHAGETWEETEAQIKMLKEDFIEKWPHTFHHGDYFQNGYTDMVQDEAKGMEDIYIRFFKEWQTTKQTDKQQYRKIV